MLNLAALSRRRTGKRGYATILITRCLRCEFYDRLMHARIGASDFSDAVTLAMPIAHVAVPHLRRVSQETRGSGRWHVSVVSPARSLDCRVNAGNGALDETFRAAHPHLRKSQCDPIESHRERRW